MLLAGLPRVKQPNFLKFAVGYRVAPENSRASTHPETRPRALPETADNAAPVSPCPPIPPTLDPDLPTAHRVGMTTAGAAPNMVRRHAVFFLCTVALLVGDACAGHISIAWKVPMTPNTIAVAKGDTISFAWIGDHNVYQMRGAEAIASPPCDFTGATFLGSVSPVEFTMGDEAVYFGCAISGLPAGTHCGAAGQKLTLVRPSGNATTESYTTTLSAAELERRASHLVAKLVVLAMSLVFVLLVVIRVLRVHRRVKALGSGPITGWARKGSAHVFSTDSPQPIVPRLVKTPTFVGRATAVTMISKAPFKVIMMGWYVVLLVLTIVYLPVAHAFPEVAPYFTVVYNGGGQLVAITGIFDVLHYAHSIRYLKRLHTTSLMFVKRWLLAMVAGVLLYGVFAAVIALDLVSVNIYRIFTITIMVTEIAGYAYVLRTVSKFIPKGEPWSSSIKHAIFFYAVALAARVGILGESHAQPCRQGIPTRTKQ